jgi:hypothetical protein
LLRAAVQAWLSGSITEALLLLLLVHLTTAATALADVTLSMILHRSLSCV